MIVFGTRGKVLPGPRKQGIACAGCGKEEHATYGVLRYFHVFWIPIFPTAREPVLECAHCKKVLRGKEVPERVRKEIAEKVFTRGRMLPTFTGLVIFAVLVAFASFEGAERKKQEAAYLAQPAVGDVYVVKLARFASGYDPKFPWGVLRVAGVAGGIVELQLGKYGYERAAVADRAIRAGKHGAGDYFAPDKTTLPIQELEPLRSGGTIYSVRR